MNSLILHIPHSSTEIPAKERREILLTDEELSRNLLAYTDWATADLYDFPAAHRVVFPVSRIVCDPERFRMDVDEPMAARGQGAIYTCDAFLQPLRSLSQKRREELLRLYYDTHHEKLLTACKEALAQTGRCLVVDCHSFEPTPLPYEPDQFPERPDFCLGTDTLHTPSELTATAVEFLQHRGFTVSINTPYAGCLIPVALYGDTRVMGIMIEINRRLYRQPDALAPNESYNAIKSVIGELLNRIITWPQA